MFDEVQTDILAHARSGFRQSVEVRPFGVAPTYVGSSLSTKQPSLIAHSSHAPAGRGPESPLVGYTLLNVFHSNNLC
jgi:hypothetical protein